MSFYDGLEVPGGIRVPGNGNEEGPMPWGE